MKFICIYHVNNYDEELDCFLIEAEDFNEASKCAKMKLEDDNVDSEHLMMEIFDLDDLQIVKLTKKVITEYVIEEIKPEGVNFKK